MTQNVWDISAPPFSSLICENYFFMPQICIWISWYLELWMRSHAQNGKTELFHIKPAHRFSAVVIEHGRNIINQCYSWLCKTMNMCRCLLHCCIKLSKFTTVFTITEKFLKGWATRNHLTIITGSGLTFFQRVKTWERTSLIFLQQQSEDETAALTICNNICCTFKHPFSPSEEKAESPLPLCHLHNQMSFKNPLRTLRTYRRIWKQTLCIFNVPDIQVNHICFSV